jgi:hypothetical protein
MTKLTGKAAVLEQVASEPADTPNVSALATFRAHPATNLTIQSFTTSFNGLQAVWAFESENKFGQSVAIFLKDIFVQVALPLLSLLWLALSTVYRTARKPETKAAIIARYEAVKTWASPKFGYERDAEQVTLPTD